ncbi:hypothetical protein OE88DRAFT_532095 [Heliocybe sulcata]|uniref:Myosin-binding domain-containing protein n=1 Tax=Heliocybe sulcata TaxID=5364 RepID=A0A5C3MUL7_9AGAM|nr:hypothetical protein OE88DRAFT_532095 [Heliocybe sulcata]
MLHELIHAGNAWDTAVNEVFSIVELDEKRYENSTYCSPASPSSPTSPLRISLQTTLHTTTNQCDNIRQLLSAVTCPTSLSQLSEMYAPPSPSASPLRQTFTGSSSGRPTSFPDRTLRSDIEEEKENKRATWNGSYTSLAFSGKDRRKEKRRSDLSAILQPPASAPATPSLGNVVEEDGQEGNAEVEADGEAELGDEYFGKDALGLRRRRRAGGINSMIAMSTPPPSAPPSPLSPRYQAQLQPEPRRRTTSLTKRRSMASLSTSLPAGSRYTLMPAARHPLSLTSIHTSLQNALAAKRYACAHLLALRFQDEDEAYWEDVKSVVSLLKSTFEDASERLGEALQQTYDRRARDGSMTPLSTHSRVVSLEDTPRKSRAQAEKERTAMVMEDLLAVPSFAPMPSQLTRFATHAETISTALGDARVHLEECMVSLRAVEPQVQSEEETEVPGQLPPALEAYERLRRELGLALRECERGRERLLDLLTPRRPARAEESDEADDLPALGPDVGSDESDKHDSMTPLVPPGSAELVAVVDPETLGREDALDDVTSHLLLGTSSQHLPPPGIEQVYESDSVDRAAFTREKSKLSREERIRLMKERREKAGSLYLRPSSVDEAQESPTADQWGPGGDVVQELKDVIWQVGEKRRKIGEGHRSLPSLPEATSTPGLDDKESRTLS